MPDNPLARTAQVLAQTCEGHQHYHELLVEADATRVAGAHLAELLVIADAVEVERRAVAAMSLPGATMIGGCIRSISLN